MPCALCESPCAWLGWTSLRSLSTDGAYVKFVINVFCFVDLLKAPVSDACFTLFTLNYIPLVDF